MPGHGFLGVEKLKERWAAWEKLGDREKEERTVKDVGPWKGSDEGELGRRRGGQRRMAVKQVLG